MKCSVFNTQRQRCRSHHARDAGRLCQDHLQITIHESDCTKWSEVSLKNACGTEFTNLSINFEYSQNWTYFEVARIKRPLYPLKIDIHILYMHRMVCEKGSEKETHRQTMKQRRMHPDVLHNSDTLGQRWCSVKP